MGGRRRFLRFFMFPAFVAVVAFFLWGSSPVHAGPGGGTWYANSPAGGSSGTAIRKFVASLPGLGAANANNFGQ